MASSPVDASTIVITYAATLPISDGTGPSPASRYCPVPPSTLGIMLLSSAKLSAMNIFRIITTNMGRINAGPAIPIPVPSDTRQLVATISPTVTEIPSKSDNFFILPPHPASEQIRFIPQIQFCADTMCLCIFIHFLAPGNVLYRHAADRIQYDLIVTFSARKLSV